MSFSAIVGFRALRLRRVGYSGRSKDAKKQKSTRQRRPLTAASRKISRMPKHRFTSRERVDRISQRIQKAGRKGISVRQIASRERISTGRTNHYLRLIRGKQKDRAKIERLDKKYYYLEPAHRKKRGTTRHPEPQERENAQLAEKKPLEELRGYINYASSRHRSRDIDIDCVILVENDRAAVLAGSRRITDIVERRFGSKLARMLKFGVSPATAESANHFLFRRHGGDWIAF